MSRPQYGSDMDRPTTGDIIRRARERAEAGLPREDYETILARQAEVSNTSPTAPSIPPRNRPAPGAQGGGQPRQQPRPQAPPGFQDRDGQITLPISRPAPVPQWPLAGPLTSPASSPDSEPYRPPAGSSPPQRPPRPSQVPSILDGSKVQDPTPVFQYRPQDNRDSENATSSIPETPSTLSRPSTLSSVGSIPDFPLPIQAPAPPPTGLPRRSVNLGPPPSARRGASSFYSHLSYVSPIPEESPRSRSHTSYASSAAMPESWGTPSPADSPRYAEAFYDDIIIEERSQSEAQSIHDDDDDDESRLVRSASVGRRGRAALVTTGSREGYPGDAEESDQRPSPTPLQPSPFSQGTGFLEASSSSSTVPSGKTAEAPPVGAALTADAILNAYDAASATDPRASRRMSASPQPPQATAQSSREYSRFSAIRRPPRLDMDAVKEAEARGSLTSLPDLIRRATRLAASLERGKRPASRFNDLDDFPPEFYGGAKSANVDKDSDEFYDKHQSGLSDMLAAFPPPAQAQSRTGIRQSIRDSVLSWPLPPRNNGSPPQGPDGEMYSDRSTPESQKKGRRCCGLPMWGFLLIVVVIIILIAAAVIIPIEFFIIRRQNASNTMAEAEQQCKQQVTCQNGGTNVVTNGFCSCICTNGFTSFDCSVSDTVGCTTADISGGTNTANATLGDAIPRLISQAQTNFSIALDGTTILSRLNAGNLSCSAENALVTFDGQDTRVGAAADTVLDVDITTGSKEVVRAVPVEDNTVATITVMAGQSSTTTLTIAVTASTPSTAVTSISPTTTVTITKTFTSSWPPASPTSVTTTTTAASATSAAPSASSTAFTVTQQVLDFARVGVLFVLQQDSLTDASTAQSTLQMFLASTTTITAASNVTLSSGNTIDLVNLRIDVGGTVAGGMGTTGATARQELKAAELDLWDRNWPIS